MYGAFECDISFNVYQVDRRITTTTTTATTMNNVLFCFDCTTDWYSTLKNELTRKITHTHTIVDSVKGGRTNSFFRYCYIVFDEKYNSVLVVGHSKCYVVYENKINSMIHIKMVQHNSNGFYDVLFFLGCFDSQQGLFKFVIWYNYFSSFKQIILP